MRDAAGDSHARSRRAGERAAKTTSVRVVAEVVGKLATLILLAALTRAVGPSGVGVYFAALAFMQVALIPVGLGSDPYLLRQVARDRDAMHRLFFNFLGMKLAMALPVLAVAFLLLHVAGYDEATREAAYVLTAGLLIDLLAKTFEVVFVGSERGELVALSLVIQRLASTAIGLTLLALGYGVIAVAASYSIGSALGLVVSIIALRRSIGWPKRLIERQRWPRLAATSFPFAVQEVVNVLLFRLDAVLLSLLATSAALGRYGSAYRLLESSLFVAWALMSAFSAMYAYLERDSQPSVGSVFGRSIKLALVLLFPFGLVLGVLAEPICVLAFGEEFRSAAPAVRLLAPVAVTLCLVALCSSLIQSRLTPRPLVKLVGSAVVLNVILNVVLIPPLDDRGAALAMLVTEVLLVLGTLRLSARAVGGLPWRATVAGPVLAGTAMFAAMLPLAAAPALSLVAGLAAYGVVLVVYERRVNPGDFSFVTALLRRTLRLAAPR